MNTNTRYQSNVNPTSLTVTPTRTHNNATGVHDRNWRRVIIGGTYDLFLRFFHDAANIHAIAAGW